MSEAKLERWATLAAQGDRTALAELYQHLAPRVYGLCRRLLRNREAAEDSTSEVFLKAQRALEAGNYDPAQPLDRWLLSIAGHLCVDLLRRGGLESRWFVDPEGAGETGRPSLLETASTSWTSSSHPGALERLVERETHDELRAALEKLPERYRVVLTLRYQSEMSYDEIAATLGLKRNLVATLIYRAKAELRQALTPTGDSGS
jgi:RNA polymerase sigma-70 factor (ECF subfamily)